MSRGGDKLKVFLKRQIADFKGAYSKVVKVGVIENQHYDDETPVAYIAAIHEYGSPKNNIPARPFFHPTIARQKKKWSNTIRSKIKNGSSVTNALSLAGEVASGDVVKTISEIDSPALAIPTKIARNRKAHRPYANGRKRQPKSISIKPLVDTGLLIKSISYQIVDKEGE